MYIIINLDPDGDFYSLHTTQEAAQKVFDAKVLQWSEAVNRREPVGWDDYKTLFCKITNMEDFGFGAYGDLYGMELIDSLNWEGDQE